MGCKHLVLPKSRAKLFSLTSGSSSNAMYEVESIAGDVGKVNYSLLDTRSPRLRRGQVHEIAVSNAISIMAVNVVCRSSALVVSPVIMQSEMVSKQSASLPYLAARV